MEAGMMEGDKIFDALFFSRWSILIWITFSVVCIIGTAFILHHAINTRAAYLDCVDTGRTRVECLKEHR